MQGANNPFNLLNQSYRVTTCLMYFYNGLGKYFSSHAVVIDKKISAILKPLKTKIAFLDFLKIEAAFLKTNCITFSYVACQWKKYEGNFFP